MTKNASKTTESEVNENEFEKPLSNPIPMHPLLRTPLNAIPDPSQIHDTDHHHVPKEKSELVSGSSTRAVVRSSDRSVVNTTPARSVFKNGTTSGVGPCSGTRASLCGGGRGGSSSRVSRGTSNVSCEPAVPEVQHFELVEDPSFWNDHNVQVLIRMRPLSNTERISQGYGRCLRQESSQTLLWLGHPEIRFTFDHIACETISQEKLFRVAGMPMVDNCMSGYNSCMFAYGQTGSGKTYTMMGEISQLDGNLTEDCGITPRLFEYLFARIEEEEEYRRDERLEYSCKCSFLEIYNEQITDLLEPSSTNLQLREDLKKGVYVENLVEYNVRTVNDVLKLLLQGAANRKVAGTHMNSESSRSHSVFTCIVESRWEKDSMTHLRFGRLNLVDLAGSERQKSSGAEGDRLKEAANINKSLSTLGLVIMSLVDLAHGKQRHVPYRDSRLTFLLQDSLGGNSKTTIIANVSPSLCSANETLSTLKFAQRAKLIQNNAKVNEDASGDVTALQRQVQLLKGQLSLLLKHHNISRSLSHLVPISQPSLGDFRVADNPSVGRNMFDDIDIPNGEKCKTNSLKTSLVGSLRREKLAETTARTLEAQIEQMNHLALQREEEAQRTKMMLRFRDEKIKRLELLADGIVNADKYLVDENTAIMEEIQLLRAKTDRNPEVTRFALENIRLIEQLRLFEDFYEQGEREKLIAEVSSLRDQLLEILEGKECYMTDNFPSPRGNEDESTAKELEECKSMNAKLVREVDELQSELTKYMNHNQPAIYPVVDNLSMDPKEFNRTGKISKIQTMSLRTDLVDEMASCNLLEDGDQQNNNDQRTENTLGLQFSDEVKDLTDTRVLLEAMESEQVCLIEELESLRKENFRLMEIVSNGNKLEREVMLRLDNHFMDSSHLENQNLPLEIEDSKKSCNKDLQVKLDQMIKDLEEARLLSSQHLVREHQIGLVREEVETETAKTIIHLQEELAALQEDLHDRLCSLSEENKRLRSIITAKEGEMGAMHTEWERASLELTNFLLDGSKSLRDASGEIESIACSFPCYNVWVGEHVKNAAKVCLEKEETILLLQRNLGDAQKMVLQMEQKLSSLRGATMALTEVQQLEADAITEEAVKTTSGHNINVMDLIEQLKSQRHGNTFVEGVTNLKFVTTDNPDPDLPRSKVGICCTTEGENIFEMVDVNTSASEDLDRQVVLTKLGLTETEKAFDMARTDAELYLSTLQTDIHKAFSLYRDLVQDFLKEINEMRNNLVEFKEKNRNFQMHRGVVRSQQACGYQAHENQQIRLPEVIDELVKTNNRLNNVRVCINTIMSMHDSPGTSKDLDGWTTDCSTSSSNLSDELVASEDILEDSSYSCCHGSPLEETKYTSAQEFEGGSVFSSGNQDSRKLESVSKNSSGNETTLLLLKKEYKKAYNGFIKLKAQLATLFKEKDLGDHSEAESVEVVNSGEQHAFEEELKQCRRPEFVADEKACRASSFFTKFEQASTTMNEADIMLNALLKANENAKMLAGLWKQTGKELMVEKANLIEEITRLKSYIHLRDEENEILQVQREHSLQEVADSMSLLEGSFLHMQKHAEDLCKTVYSDVMALTQDILHFICKSRSSLQCICAEKMEKEFASFVLQQCHMGEYFCKDSGLHPSSLQEGNRNQVETHFTDENDSMANVVEGEEEANQSEVAARLEAGELSLTNKKSINEKLELKKELEHKDMILDGLLFDFSLLQESASTRQDIKDETEKLIADLSTVRADLKMKTRQLDDMLAQHSKLEGRLADTETALCASKSELEQTKEAFDVLSYQNADLKFLLEDIYLKKSEAEEQLEELREVVKTLENQILSTASSENKQLLSSLEGIEDELRRVASERDQLSEQVVSLQETLDMSYALADENAAIAVEARQESEASKLHAEQKEEEVKILEHSVEELDCTINVLEKKVHEMEEEVERHRTIRDSLELEFQSLSQRLLTVETYKESMDSENNSYEQQPDDQLSRKLHATSLKLHEAHSRIRSLEDERAEQVKEIKQYKAYISELVLHAEAQASQYQQKYKTLEAMVRDVKTDSSHFGSEAPIGDKTEKSSTRTRGSSSPFRCITNLVQQMNTEKDQELSLARLRIEELDAMAASRQKEICMLNTRLAAAESMTHDVIRDLLGIKMDMTNYADLIDKYQLQKLMETAQQQTEESVAMEQEILHLRRQVNDLLEERERRIYEINRKEADMLATLMTVEQLQERDQLLTAQNEMLKMDKTNLQNKAAELDDIVKKLLGPQSIQPRVQPQSNILLRTHNTDLSKRLAQSEKLLLRVNDELAHYRKPDSFHLRDKTDGRGKQSLGSRNFSWDKHTRAT